MKKDPGKKEKRFLGGDWRIPGGLEEEQKKDFLEERR